jgi:MFS family permease
VLFFVHEDFERPQFKPGESRPRWWDGLALTVRSREVLIVLLARLLTRTGVRVIGPVLPLFVATLLPESSRVATMAGIVAGASAASSSIGSVVLGRAGDRVGYRRVLLASAIAATILYALQAAVTNTAQLILLQFCVGAALSGTISSLTALLAMLAPEGRQGAVYGLSTSVVSGANALGPMLGASLAVVLGNRATFLLAAGIFALSAVLVGWLLPDRMPEAGLATEPRTARHGHHARAAKTR